MVPHRSINLHPDRAEKTVAQLRTAIIGHHADGGRVARIKRQLERLGFDLSKLPSSPFPQADKTRKGNLAEIFLAEYISSSSGATLPIYRLRFNPNVEQSMKGDDVLAFDFSADPVRILVGEAKFRSTPSKNSVQNMVKALLASHRCGVPASLQFIADMLFSSGNSDLGQRIEDCAEMIASGTHDLRYVGLLMSTGKCKETIDEHTEALLPKLVVLSFTSNDLPGFLASCYNHIEESAFGTPD